MEGSIKIKGCNTITTIKTPKVVGLKKFMVHFRRPSNYDGEYGFDWLRDEYIYPIEIVARDHDGNAHHARLELCENVTALKTKYEKMTVYCKDYYASWLTMYPNTAEANTTHSESIQTNGIDLDLEIEALETLVSDNTEILFESTNASLKITPKKLMLKNLIGGAKKTKSLGGTNSKDYYLERKKVNVKSDGGAFNNDEEIKVFAQLGLQKVEVGKMIVCKNSDYKDYTVNIYIIKSYLKGKKSNFGKSVIDKELEKIGGLQGIRDYLNQKSMNQSLIKVEKDPEQIKNKDLIFKRKSLVKASKEGKYKNMINKTTMKVDIEKYLNYMHDKFKSKYPNFFNKKGIFIYLTPFLSLRAFFSISGGGGGAYTIPLDSKHIIIAKDRIDHLPAYAHEIGHTLGLKHSFENDPSKTIDTLLRKSQTKITEYTEKVDKWIDIRDSIPNDRRYKLKRKNIKISESNISALETELQNAKDTITVLNNNILKFSREKTENIMDYSSNQKVFFKWQSDIMKQEVKTYYH